MFTALSRMSLLWKILLSTSLALTLLLGVTAWIVQGHVLHITSIGLEEEVSASFRAYESLWRSRAEMLSSLAFVLSRMSDVRSAFGTGDEATIRDTAGELWDKISHENSIFLVTDPQGRVVASLGGSAVLDLPRQLDAVRESAARFPQQTQGFMTEGGQLYQIVLTPVYVQAAGGPGLLNVLVVGYTVDKFIAERLKSVTGGSDFLFISRGKLIASTLPAIDAKRLSQVDLPKGTLERTTVDGTDYAVLVNPLLDVQGRPLGELRIIRSFAASRQRIATLQRNIAAIWLLAILAGLGLTFLLAQRILRPVEMLDQAAAEIVKRNYDYRVPVESQDELGRLAETFNTMCASIQEARQELIQHERMTTIGRLSTSIVHDLRNPLAAIYGGAEMLVDGNLAPTQIKRLAANMYRSSRTIQQLLQDLVDVSRGKIQPAEICRLRDVVAAAYEACAPVAESQKVSTVIDIPDDVELPLERARIERVFLNLIDNALEAMPGGGKLSFSMSREERGVLVTVEDTGPGISEEIRPRLFQPFVSAGKKNGLGLGLALSRQTLLDHGGDLWADSSGRTGARFVLRFVM
jgi:signal transduction histidine kinase